MKKAFSLILVIIILLQCCLCLSGCNGFSADISMFKENGDFYKNVLNTLGSAFCGDDVYYNYDESSLLIDISAILDNYKLNGEQVSTGQGSFDLSALITKNYDIDADLTLKAFEENSSLSYISVNNDMLLEFEGRDKPYYYKGEGEGLIRTALKYYNDELVKAKLFTGKESFKLHGNNISANTVEFCFNSDVTSQLANKITTLLINTPNLALNELYFLVQEYVYMIQREKLHLTWKRYFDGSDLCRESFKLHDNYNHYYLLDIAFVSAGKHSYAEISLTAYNGDNTLTVFTASVDKEGKNDAGFKTTMQFIIGDELCVTSENSGNASETKGKANVNFITELGEVSLPIKFSYSADNTDGKNQAFKASTDNLFITFDLSVKWNTKHTDEEVKIARPSELYDLSKLEDMFGYSYIAVPLFKASYSNTWLQLQGKPPVEPIIPEDEVEPYTIDISFDSGTELETNGRYGKEYIDLLHSENYAFRYYSYEDKEGVYKTNTEEYKSNDELIYKYNYSSGKKYTQLLKNNTKYEAHYDIEKIIYSEYDEDDFEKEFPKRHYQYYQSGYCEYGGRKLVYERYFDKQNNYYTFVFDENRKLEIISLYSKTEDSTLFMFVEQLDGTIPTDAFDMPDFEKVSIQDFFE